MMGELDRFQKVLVTDKELTDDDVRLVGPVIPVSTEYLEDMRAMHEYIESMFARAANHLKWWALGSRDPWPRAGFDFRLNAPHNRYPEPEICGECGSPLDDE